MHELERVQENRAFRVRLLALEERHFTLLEKVLEAQEQQAAMVARAVEAIEEDCQVLDTILSLGVSFVLPTTQSLVLALPAPWQSLAMNTWADVQQCPFDQSPLSRHACAPEVVQSESGVLDPP
ncbi:hypothetical protein Y1Q_0022703 [Alligator mississippiensis]|uniref:Uncharacterized protein n=1 Tax=Alligator mississippiensis TaxID=8496 RepID=A0A151MY33_ALLMI|nr:hypothetical protein Y1Q_0022703 [Alligator mississippiensis]